MAKKTIHFGTDGIRGNATQFPFTHDALIILGQAVATWSLKKYGSLTAQPQVLIGHDTRQSCDQIKNALFQGLMTQPLTVVDAEIIPTPAVFKLLQIHNQEFTTIKNAFNFGIVISASHNSAQDNGIKFFDAHHGKLTAQDEQEIEELFSEAYQNQKFLPQHSNAYKISWPEAQQLYIKKIRSSFSPKLLTGKTIVLDCAHGATFDVAQAIFKQLGAHLIALFITPDGTNINQNCGAVYPQILAREVLRHQAYAGFAFDGDGDRVIAVNQDGIIKDGDDILAILLENQELINTSTIVGTIMTNHGFDLLLQAKNKKLIRTPVGDKYITARLEQEELLLGGEASGHIIIGNYLMSGDGIFTALKLLQTMLSTNNHEMKSFIKLPQKLLNIPIDIKIDLTSTICTELITSCQAELKNGRIVIRYSDTEPLLRIMTEGENQEITEKIAHKLATQFTNLLTKTRETL